MSCAATRERLLGSEQPDRPAAEERRHLAGCPSCRAWHRRLVGLEQHIPLLPVPPSRPPAALFARILRPAGAPLLTPHPALLSSFRPRREGARQKLALALALAASLALFAVGWWAWPHHAAPAARPALARYAERRDRALATARTPQHRVERLTDLADELLAEVRTHPDRPDRAAELASHFRQLVGHDLPWHAGQLPPADRRAALLSVADRLGKIESEASRLAADWRGQHAAVGASLRQIADAAREADSGLRRLAAV
jgi:hypothetical protein